MKKTRNNQFLYVVMGGVTLALVILGNVGSRETSSPATKQASSTTDPRANVSAITNRWRFYVDPYTSARKQVEDWTKRRPSDALALEKIASQPMGMWFGDWNDDVEKDVVDYVTRAAEAGAVAVIVAYNIPGRDCGSYSAGGAYGDDAYLDWVHDFANGIGSREVIVVLEPDAIATDCVTDERLYLMDDAVGVLKANANTHVYIDAGHDNWVPAETMAGWLQKAGIEHADGFALNVSNFYTTEENESYGEELSDLLNGAHFIIDTGRNGNGWNGEWCNPSGRKIGANPTTDTGNPLVDAWLWVKPPGHSDGECNGGPSPGTWWPEYALELVTTTP